MGLSEARCKKVGMVTEPVIEVYDTSKRKIEKISKQQVIQILYNMGDNEEVYAALNTLNEIPEHEKLAYVRPPHLHARTKLRWDEMNPNQMDNPKQVNYSLPLFFPCEEQQPLPYGNRLESPEVRKPR